MRPTICKYRLMALVLLVFISEFILEAMSVVASQKSPDRFYENVWSENHTSKTARDVTDTLKTSYIVCLSLRSCLLLLHVLYLFVMSSYLRFVNNHTAFKKSENALQFSESIPLQKLEAAYLR